MKNTIIILLSLISFQTVFAQSADSLAAGSAVVETGLTTENRRTTTRAVSTVSSEQIAQFDNSDPYDAMAGTLSGLTALPSLGWNAGTSLYVRGGGTLSGKSPLIIVDGFRRSDISRLTGAEIENISVLKDGAATALYGASGANGVIVITTKRGKYDTMDVDIDYRFGVGQLHSMPEFVDAATYALAMNEALIYDGLSPKYSINEVDAFRSGKYPELYPNVNWLEEGFRDFTTNHQFNASFSGGGGKLRYFTHVNYMNDMGFLKNTDYSNMYSSQMRKNQLTLRINLDVDVTRTTKVSLNLHGALFEMQRPSDSDCVSSFYKIPALAFPVKTADGYWGSDTFFKYNPVAKVADSGFFKQNSRELFADMRIRQDMSALTAGLYAEAAVAYDSYAAYNETQSKNYYYQTLTPVMDDETNEILSVSRSRYGEESTLAFSSSLASQTMRTSFDGKIGYDRNFGRHSVDAALMYRQYSSVANGRNTIRRYQDILLYGSYNYSGRYFVDIAANYSGNSVLLKNNKFTFYPSISAAWAISSEPFMENVKGIDLLKLRLSYGSSGYSDFGYELDRVYYVDGKDYFFGSANNSAAGMNEDALPVSTLENERSHKYNIGLDMTFFKGLDMTADLFAERRSGILLSTDAIYSDVLGIAPAQENDGIVDSRGIDASLNWRGQAGDFKYNIGGTFSFARTNIVENNEGAVAEPYLSKKGTRLGQFFGLEAIGFFADENDIASSPEQEFSDVRPGDIKYKDQNGDNIINSNDMIPLGYSTLMPEIFYGINIGLEWKGLGLTMNFTGAGNYSTVLTTTGLYRPMTNNANLSKWYWSENVRWTENTRETANLPRLSTEENLNNTQNSSLWLRDASYFKLQNACIYYDLPQRWCKKMKMTRFRLYVRGEDLFSIDGLPYSDPNNSGTLYPEIRTFFVGLNIRF